jgi:peptide/nickel transport system permease protein
MSDMTASQTITSVKSKNRRTRSQFFERYPALVLLAATWIAFLVIVAVFADQIAPFHYTTLHLRDRLHAPIWAEEGSWTYPLGTDELGRDLLSRLIYSCRISFLVAFLGTLIGAVIGTVLGFVAAHFRGWVDNLVMAAIDFQAAIPFIILALALLAFCGNSLTLFIIILGIYGWERYARITRGLALSAQTHGYAVAVKTLGASPWRVYGRHILPNIANALIVNATLNFPETILTETSLSFLGVGVQPPLTSLGSMLGFGRNYLSTEWWIAVFPGLVIFLATLAMSMLGDWLRDHLDPGLK